MVLRDLPVVYSDRGIAGAVAGLTLYSARDIRRIERIRRWCASGRSWRIWATPCRTLSLIPFLLIASAVFYFDLRVRKEAFDLQFMMDPESERTTGPSSRRNAVYSFVVFGRRPGRAQERCWSESLSRERFLRACICFRRLDPFLLARLQIECVTLDIFDDVFLQDLSLEALERALETLARHSNVFQPTELTSYRIGIYQSTSFRQPVPSGDYRGPRKRLLTGF